MECFVVVFIKNCTNVPFSKSLMYCVYKKPFMFFTSLMLCLWWFLCNCGTITTETRDCQRLLIFFSCNYDEPRRSCGWHSVWVVKSSWADGTRGKKRYCTLRHSFLSISSKWLALGHQSIQTKQGKQKRIPFSYFVLFWWFNIGITAYKRYHMWCIQCEMRLFPLHSASQAQGWVWGYVIFSKIFYLIICSVLFSLPQSKFDGWTTELSWCTIFYWRGYWRKEHLAWLLRKAQQFGFILNSDYRYGFWWVTE